MSLDLTSVMILLGLQLGALAWRVRREINGLERHPFPFVPVPDNVNIAAMIAVLYFCVIAPATTTGLRLYSVGVMGRATFVAAAVLLVTHPIVVASHYRLWGGRRSAARRDDPLPYCTAQEVVVQLVALAIAGVVFLAVIRAANAERVILPGG